LTWWDAETGPPSMGRPTIPIAEGACPRRAELGPSMGIRSRSFFRPIWTEVESGGFPDACAGQRGTGCGSSTRSLVPGVCGRRLRRRFSGSPRQSSRCVNKRRSTRGSGGPSGHQSSRTRSSSLLRDGLMFGRGTQLPSGVRDLGAGEEQEGPGGHLHGEGRSMCERRESRSGSGRRRRPTQRSTGGIVCPFTEQMHRATLWLPSTVEPPLVPRVRPRRLFKSHFIDYSLSEPFDGLNLSGRHHGYASSLGEVLG